MSAIPFNINISDEQILKLKQKLAWTEFPNGTEIKGEDLWARGPPVNEIKRLAKVWHTTYDWRKTEAYLNTFPQYVTTIAIDSLDSYKIHFIHKRSPNANSIPLLFLHGWPGSFIEVTKILNTLTEINGEEQTFHVVAPSLVDFGFSSGSGNVRI
jgi:pimeloyl-ACP methyl ester carboxylesterase